MRRTLLACVAVAALAGPALAQAPAPTWAQAGSDIAPDPSVRFFEQTRDRGRFRSVDCKPLGASFSGERRQLVDVPGGQAHL